MDRLLSLHRVFKFYFMVQVGNILFSCLKSFFSFDTVNQLRGLFQNNMNTYIHRKTQNNKKEEERDGKREDGKTIHCLHAKKKPNKSSVSSFLPLYLTVVFCTLPMSPTLTLNLLFLLFHLYLDLTSFLLFLVLSYLVTYDANTKTAAHLLCLSHSEYN